MPKVEADQCPRCYQRGLDPRATKCHHCGGNIKPGGCITIIRIVIYLILAVIVSWLILRRIAHYLAISVP